jgi:hypothetical protein
MSVCVLRLDLAALIICENEQEHRPVISHREASHLLTGETIAYIDILISWAVTVHRKCCDHVPEIFLEPVLFSEYEFPNDRMEAVCSNHHVEVSRSCALEYDTHPALVLFKLRNAVTENALTTSFHFFVDDFGQFTAGDAHITAIGRRTKDFGIESSDSPAIRVDKTKLFNILSLAFNGGKNPHLLCHIEAAAPKIDDITTRAQTRCYFDERCLETMKS